MYTLRIINHETNDAYNIYLGSTYYTVSDQINDSDIIIRVRGERVPEEGIAININDFACVMGENGKTFSVLNNPKKTRHYETLEEAKPIEHDKIRAFQIIDGLCLHGLEPTIHTEWESVKEGLILAMPYLNTPNI